jgi:hypothetical protein
MICLLHTGGDDEIFRLFLLQHEHSVASVAVVLDEFVALCRLQRTISATMGVSDCAGFPPSRE